jgi:hypothetical protein
VNRTNVTAAALAAASMVAACAPKDVSPALTPVDPATARLSSYQPSRPPTTTAAGTMERPLFHSRAGTVEVDARDVVVPPRRTLQMTARALTVYDWRDGQGTVSIAGKETALRPGAVFVLAAGETAQFRADASALWLRVQSFAEAKP